jgi:hypothetical protein
MMAPSNRQQVEALSGIGDIIVQISDADLERMESLAQRITQFDRELGERILAAQALLIQLNDEVESALERLESDREDTEEDETMEAAEAEANETDAEDEEDTGEKRGKPRSNRNKSA